MQNEQLLALSHRVRRHVIKMATSGGCFIGASLSCVDILTYLYGNWLNLHRDRLADPDRDYLLLSKGHDVPALYGLFAEMGFIEPERLGNHLRPDDDIYWHPNRNIPGIEFHSGSLGHLLSVGLGIAPVPTISLALDNHWFKPALMAEALEYEGFTAAKIAASILQRIHEARS